MASQNTPSTSRAGFGRQAAPEEARPAVANMMRVYMPKFKFDAGTLDHDLEEQLERLNALIRAEHISNVVMTDYSSVEGSYRVYSNLGQTVFDQCNGLLEFLQAAEVKSLIDVTLVRSGNNDGLCPYEVVSARMTESMYIAVTRLRTLFLEYGKCSGLRLSTFRSLESAFLKLDRAICDRDLTSVRYVKRAVQAVRIAHFDRHTRWTNPEPNSQDVEVQIDEIRETITDVYRGMVDRLFGSYVRDGRSADAHVDRISSFSSQ